MTMKEVLGMKNIFKNSLIEGVQVKTKLQDKEYTDKFEVMGDLLVEAIRNNKKLLFCGNGGSAADAQHLAAELLVRLRPTVNRSPIPAIALAMDTSTITACGNDFGFKHLFERNILALGNKGDVLICISTSGMSENIELAAIAAKSIGVTTCAFLGNEGGTLKNVCDYSIIIPSFNTARIQECHIVLGHALMEYLEEKLLALKFIEKF